MPGHTIAEKILAAKSGRTSVRPGEIVDAYPDLVMSHTATWRSVSVMQKVGATKLYDPDRLAVVLDHIAPAKTEKNATDQQQHDRAARRRLRRAPLVRSSQERIKDRERKQGERKRHHQDGE